MKLCHLVQIWVCTPQEYNQAGEISNLYTNLRSEYVNIQRDYSEADIAVYGQTVQEVVKFRTLSVPNIREFDHIYIEQPKPAAAETEDGTVDYGKGIYYVESVIPSVPGSKQPKNPTVITARKVN